MIKHTVNDIPVELLGFTEDEEKELIKILEHSGLKSGLHLFDFWEAFCKEVEGNKIVNICIACARTICISKVRLDKSLYE